MMVLVEGRAKETLLDFPMDHEDRVRANDGVLSDFTRRSGVC